MKTVSWFRVVLFLALASYAPKPALASKNWVDSPLAPETQTQLKRAASYAKSKRMDKANPIFTAAIDSCNDIPKCLAIATFTENYGHPLLEVRRQCLSKALSLCSTSQDYLQVALKSRQYECFEITREAINRLINGAHNNQDLYDLAHKAQEVALNDVAHLAMEKAYTQTKTVPDALTFSREARVLGMDDLLRKCIKDVIDDESSVPELMSWLNAIEPYNIVDLNRYLLKKGLDSCVSLDDYFSVLKAAKRHGETDIVSVSLYRGKRQNIIQQIKKDQAAWEEKMGQAQERANQDLSKQGQTQAQPNSAGF